MNSNHHLLREVRERRVEGLSYVPRGWIIISFSLRAIVALFFHLPRSRNTSCLVSSSPPSFRLAFSPLYPHLVVSPYFSGVAGRLPIPGASSPFPPTRRYPLLPIQMGFPHALVNKVIDCIGRPYIKTNPPYAFFRRQRHNEESRQVDLLSWARVSKACNRRVRSYLFSHCRVIGINPLTTLKQHPYILVEHTRILEILHLSDLETLEAIVRRFGSAPVVHVTMSSVPIQIGLPAIFTSALGNVTSVSLIGCSYDPVALRRFVGGFGCIDEVHLRNCQTGHPLNAAGSVLPKLPPLKRHKWTTDPRRVLRRVTLPVRTLRIESLADRAEDRLIHAWSESLEHLDVKMSNTWGMYSSPLSLLATL